MATIRGLLGIALMCAILSGLYALHAEANAVAGTATPEDRGAAIEKFVRELPAKVARNLLAFSRVNVSGNYYVSDSDVLTAAGLDREPWIWKHGFGSLDQALAHYPWIASHELSWTLYPLALNIAVHEAKPWLVVELGSVSWLVSRDARLLQPLSTIKDTELIVDSVKLPRLDGIAVSGAEDPSLTVVSERLQRALRMLRFYQIAAEFPFEVERFTYLGDEGLMITPAQRRRYPAVLLSDETFSDARAAIVNLKRVLDDLNERGERAARIDLRFDGQAVVRPVEAETAAVAQKQARNPKHAR